MNDLGITKDELLNLAAEKLADQLADSSELDSLVMQKVETRVQKAFAETAEKVITETLSKAAEDLLSKQYQPVDLWGERVGKPTTLRDQIAERARAFFDERVSDDGKPSSWGGKPRHEYLYGKVLTETFQAAIKANVEGIVAQFKAAITDDAIKITKEHINKLIK